MQILTGGGGGGGQFCHFCATLYLFFSEDCPKKGNNYKDCKDKQFSWKSLFWQAKISIKNFQFWLFGGNNQIFSYQTNFEDIAEV